MSFYAFLKSYRPKAKSSHDLGQILGSTVRGLVVSQQKLDDLGRNSLLIWEEEGIPPTVWTWAGCRFDLPVSYSAKPKEHNGQNSRLQIAPRQHGLGKLTFSVRYLEKPQDQEDSEYAGENLQFPDQHT